MKTSFTFKIKRLHIYLLGIIATSILTLSSCLKDSNQNGDSIVSALTVVHGSPDAPSVDFVWDNQRVNIQEFAYKNRIKYFTDYSGNHLARFYMEGTNANALYETQVSLTPGKYFSLFLSGTLDSLSSVLLEDDAEKPAEGNAKIRFINLSPDAGPLDLQLVDDSLTASNKDFQKYTSFQEMEAGEYAAKIKSTSGTTVNDQFDLTLEEGKTYTLWARGLVTTSDPEQEFDHGIIEHGF